MIFEYVVYSGNKILARGEVVAANRDMALVKIGASELETDWEENLFYKDGDNDQKYVEDTLRIVLRPFMAAPAATSGTITITPTPVQPAVKPVNPNPWVQPYDHPLPKVSWEKKYSVINNGL